MMFFEIIMQETLSWANISPSIFLETKLEKKTEEKNRFEKFEDLLACPSCKGDLIFEGSSIAKCSKCSSEFLKKEGIWDFRVK
jgi:hypothetical protein